MSVVIGGEQSEIPSSFPVLGTGSDDGDSAIRAKISRLLAGYAAARPNALYGGGNGANNVTVALGAAGAASPIASSVSVLPNGGTSSFAQHFISGKRATYDRGGGMIVHPPSGDFVGRRNSPSTIYPAVHGYGFGIRTTAPQIAVRVRDTNSGSLAGSIIARVNGEWVAASPITLPTTGGSSYYWYSLTFTDIFGANFGAERHVEIFFSAWTQITSINISQYYAAITDANPVKSRLGILANSYGFGQGPVNPRNSPAHQIAERFGWECDSIVNAVGGIGYVTTQNVGASSSPVKFIDLIPGLTQYSRDYFDAVVVLGALTNDGGQTPENIQTQATAFFTELKAAFPGTPKIVTGPHYWTGATSTTADRLAAEAAAFNAVFGGDSEARYVDTLGGSPSGAWQDPTNEDFYHSDGLHPSDAGGIDLGVNHAGPDIAEALRSIRAFT